MLHKKPHIVISHVMQLYFLSAKLSITLVRLFKRKYFEIEIGIIYKIYSDTNYSSNYNEIFENNNPELDG